MFRHQLRQPVIGDARELGGPIGADHALERRQSERQDLRVVVELVHHAKARIEIMDRAHALYALADIRDAAGGVRQEPKDAGRKEMTEGIDVPHGDGYSR